MKPASTQPCPEWQAPSPADAGDPGCSPASLAAIDASCRKPILLLFGAGVVWLMIGTVLALLASWKLHEPALLTDHAWLTFGRIRPAHTHAVVYGFAFQAAMGVALWLVSRLGRTPLWHPGIATCGALFWNLGMAVGTAALLGGESTGIEWLEFPRYVSPILFASYALMGIAGMPALGSRPQRRWFVSQWYLLAAVFWFPWLYSTANILLLFEPVRGAAQATVNWWYGSNLLALWFTPVGLGALYYFVPKRIGQPVHSHALAVIGFGSLALWGGWGGMQHLVGGPIPAWLVTVSIAAGLMLMTSVAANAVNLHQTMAGHFHRLRQDLALRFMVFGGMSFALAGLCGMLMALRSISEITHFTHLTIAHAHHGLYAFFSMVMFGSIYSIAPRLTGCPWPSPRLISLHFWTAAVGLLLYLGVLIPGGIAQGLAMNSPDIPFLEVVRGTIPYLRLRTAAGFVLAASHTVFLVHLAWMTARRVRDRDRPLPDAAAHAIPISGGSAP